MSTKAEEWTDQEGELEELRRAIFPREAKFPFQQAFPGANGWEPSEEGSEQVIENSFFGETVRTPRLHARDGESVRRVVHGRPKCKEDVAPKKNVIRFFVSSTFTDTKWERDSFIAFCVPYLRKISRLKNLEFCLSEMRWGVNDGLSQSHQTSAVCMRELKRCVDESAGLQFVGILGNKYGYRPFPAEIEQSLFEKLIQHVPKQDLFNTWFRLDKNQQPPVYVLKPVKEVIPNYNPNIFNKYAKQWWSECFEPMQSMLRQAAVKLSSTDKKVAKEAINFIQSVTEDEMHRGFNGKNETLLILRELEPEPGSKITDRRFMDVGDEDALTRLDNLKKEMKDKASKTGPVLEYQVPWKDRGIDPKEHAEHAEYLRKVLTEWTRIAEKSINQVKAYVPDPTFEEVQDHLRFALTKLKDFIGRASLLDKIKKAIQSSPAVVLRGLSGSGKTSLLSKVAMTELGRDGAVVLRFLGTTMASKTAVTLVHSLCVQISRVYRDQEPEDLPDDFHKLVALFHNEYLPLANARQPLFLVLDSLDQLVDAENLSWLPHVDIIPRHVKILVSTLPYLYESSVHTKQYPSVIDVEPIQPTDVKPVLDQWLTSRKRALTQEQKSAVLKIIEKAQEPTYLLLRILFNEALLWRSYSPVPESWAKITDVPSAIDALFDRIEEEHGKTFVTAVLSLLTAARDGLSTNELEDLLSLNDAVLKECFQWWVPVVARVPPLLVTRLIGALKDYLVTQHNTWFHRQFKEAAARRYDSAFSVQQIANYFSETVHVEPYMIHEKGRHNVRLSTDRRLQPQPTVFENGAYNERKLRELPTALMNTGRYTECLALLKDLQFCRGMFAKGLAQELIDFLKDHRLPEPTFRKYFHRALTQCRDEVAHDLNVLEEQLWGRLVPVLGDKDPFIRLLDSQRSRFPGLHARFSNILNAANSPLVTTIRGHTGAVEDICELQKQDGKRLMITASKDQYVKVWNVDTGTLDKSLHFPCYIMGLCTATKSNGDVLLVVTLVDASIHLFDSEKWQSQHTIKGSLGVGTGSGHSASVNAVCAVQHPSGKGTFILTASSDTKCMVWDPTTGALERTLEHHFEPVNDVCAISMRGNRNVAVSGSDDRSIVFYDVNDAFKAIKIIGGAHEGAIYAVAAVALDDGRRVLVSGSFDRTAKIWDVETYETLHQIHHDGPVTSVCGIRLIDGRGLIATGSADSTVTVVNPQTNQELVKLTGHSNEVRTLSALHTNDGRHLLASGASDSDIKLWEVGIEGSDDRQPGAGKSSHATTNATTGHSRGVTSVAPSLTQDGLSLIASGSEDTTLKLWEASTGVSYCTLECHSLGVTCVHALQLPNKGQSIVITGGRDETIGLFDVDKRSHFKTLENYSGHPNALHCIKSEAMLLYGSDHDIILYDLKTHSQVGMLSGHTSEIRAISTHVKSEGTTWVLSGSGKNSVSNEADFSVRVFSLKEKKPIFVLQGHSNKVNCVCGLDLGGNVHIAVSGADDHTLRVWDLTTGKCKSVIEAHSGGVEAVLPLPHAMRPMLVSAARFDNFKVWDALGSNLLFVLDSIAPMNPVNAISTVRLEGEKYLVVCATRQKTVDVLDPCSGKMISSTNFPGTSPLSVTEMSRGVIGVGTSNGRVTVFDITIPKQ